MLHGRNMDQTPSAARNITLALKYYKNGVLQFYAVDWFVSEWDCLVLSLMSYLFSALIML